MKPYLQFDFPSQHKPLIFTDPIEVLTTHHCKDIPNILNKVDYLLSEGYYVAGFVSYEAAPAFDSAFKVHSNPVLPLVWFGVFTKPIHIAMQVQGNFQLSDWNLSMNYRSYQDKIKQIKQAIESGDTYQVNFTTRLHAAFEGKDYMLYNQLIANQQPSYGAYVNIGRYRILSASPELFFSVKNNKIMAKPMKGTAKRGRFIAEDMQLIQHLKQSEKEKAENLMIVDLLRNDIGRIAKTGSVRVPHLFEVETYPTVHQMTSTIEAELEDNITVFDWFKALFPCGSITGAPKVRTLEYIAKLEDSPREVYCGAIGYITPNREAIFNVPIRTVLIDANQKEATYGVGGGITWDSTTRGEYDEMFTKAQILSRKSHNFQLIESLQLLNGVYPLLPYHINRLQDSANYFNFTLDRQKLLTVLERYAYTHSNGLYKVRLLLTNNGKFDIEGTSIKKLDQPIPCSVAKKPIKKQDAFLYHKTTNRQLYQDHHSSAPPDIFAVLLWNEKQELTEFTIGNLVVEQDGVLYTPPIECGLLPGTYRQYLLDKEIIKEKVLMKEDLLTFDRVWFINSVRGWLEVRIC